VYALKEPGIDEQGWMERQERTCDGILGRHFAEEEEGDVDNGADDGIADEHAGWAALCEGLASAEEEPGTDGASDGNHLDLARGKAAVEASHEGGLRRAVHR
jgi:hypothetical protein